MSENNTNTHSHHHHAHHSHHHSSHNLKRSFGANNKLSFKERFFANFSSANMLKKAASKRNMHQYNILSRRVILVGLLLVIIIAAVFSKSTEETDIGIKNASGTLSETQQLRVQVTSLQQQLDSLNKTLNEYKRLYGELPEKETD